MVLDGPSLGLQVAQLGLRLNGWRGLVPPRKVVVGSGR